LTKALNKEYTFLKGAVCSADFLVVSAVVDDLKDKSAAQLYGWLGDDWYNFGTYDWNACDVCIIKESETIVCVSDIGDVAVAQRGGIRKTEIIGHENELPIDIGKLRAIKAINNSVIAVGMGRQVYIRKAQDQWLAIDKDIRSFPSQGKVFGFEDIDGFSLENMYCVGWYGEIWHYNGKKWTQKNSPTNQILSIVCCGGDGNIYICGRRGLIIIGKGDQWEIIEQQDTIEDFWGMVWFSGKLHLASTRAIYVLDSDKLSLVDFGDDIPSTCYDLSVSEDVLYSVGEKDLMLFNNGNWQRLD
jgi:hypothetical protein